MVVVHLVVLVLVVVSSSWTARGSDFDDEFVGDLSSSTSSLVSCRRECHCDEPFVGHWRMCGTGPTVPGNLVVDDVFVDVVDNVVVVEIVVLVLRVVCGCCWGC